MIIYNKIQNSRFQQMQQNSTQTTIQQTMLQTPIANNNQTVSQPIADQQQQIVQQKPISFWEAFIKTDKISMDSHIQQVNQFISSKVMTRSGNLLKIELNNNKIKSLEFLATLQEPNLNCLYLDNNLIENLEPLNRTCFQELKELRLYQNRISSAQSLAKATFPLMARLEMENNYMIQFSVYGRLLYPELVRIDINNNLIDSLRHLMVNAHPGLQYLRLFENKWIERYSKCIFGNEKSKCIVRYV